MVEGRIISSSIDFHASSRLDMAAKVSSMQYIISYIGSCTTVSDTEEASQVVMWGTGGLRVVVR